VFWGKGLNAPNEQAPKGNLAADKDKKEKAPTWEKNKKKKSHPTCSLQQLLIWETKRVEKKNEKTRCRT